MLFATHPAYLEHLTGPGHPERPSRLQAVIAGAQRGGVADALVPLEPVAATRDDLERVHPAWYLDRLRAMAAEGGGWIDADTRLEHALGRGRRARRRRRAHRRRRAPRGQGDAAFCAVRPPGHHATPTDSMGFCLVSNIAIVAAALADAGERVWVLDYDAHHGNGTQAVFVEDPRVLFVSLHQWPLYPGTGRVTETGTGAGQRDDDERPAAAGRDRRRLPPGVRRGRRAGRRAVRADVAAHLGRASTPTATIRSPSSG